MAATTTQWSRGRDLKMFSIQFFIQKRNFKKVFYEFRIVQIDFFIFIILTLIFFITAVFLLKTYVGMSL